MITSLQQFFEFEVVTNIKVKKVEEVVFPAVTLCEHLSQFNIKFNEIKFENIVFNFTEIFEEITIFYFGSYMKCFQFNAKKASSDKRLRILRQFGYDYGLKLNLSFPYHIHYYIGENNYQPVDKHFASTINTDHTTKLSIYKTISKALGQPYNNCIKEGESFDSDLFRETINSGYTYRVVNCYDKCLQKFYNKTCLSSEFTYRNDCYNNFTVVFNYTESCKRFCPTECDTITYSEVL